MVVKQTDAKGIYIKQDVMRIDYTIVTGKHVRKRPLWRPTKDQSMKLKWRISK